MREDEAIIWLALSCILLAHQTAEGGVCFTERCSHKKQRGCRGMVDEDNADDCCLAGDSVGFYDDDDYIGGGCYRCHSCHDILGRVDGGWSDWTDWTQCSKSCGGGVQFKTRHCNNPEPSALGRACEGNERLERKCNTDTCPVHGKWSDWSEWTECSTTCGKGRQERTRTCTNPRPRFGGRDCAGKAKMTEQCHEIEFCPINGGWGKWSEWSPCSKSCGEGLNRRHRQCNRPRPQHGGRDCEGYSEESEFCNSQPCPVNGQWSDWSEDGPCISSNCSAKSKEGVTLRTRSCTNPAPVFGGRMCQGRMFDRRFCLQPVNCPVDGGFSDWSRWECKSCQHAVRSRKCNNPTPQLGGKTCQGNEADVKRRNTNVAEFCRVCPQHCPCRKKEGGRGGRIDDSSQEGDEPNEPSEPDTGSGSGDRPDQEEDDA